MNPQEKLFWINYLQGKAREIGLDGRIRQVKPQGAVVGPVTWEYDDGAGVEALGWTVEQAEERLRQIARQ